MFTILLFLLIYAETEVINVGDGFAIRQEESVVIKSFMDVIVNLKIKNDILTVDDHSCLENRMASEDEDLLEIVNSINQIKQNQFDHLLKSIGLKIHERNGLTKTHMNCRGMKEACGEEDYSCCADKLDELSKIYCDEFYHHEEIETTNDDSIIYSSQCYRMKLPEELNFAVTKFMNYTHDVTTRNEIGEMRVKIIVDNNEGIILTDLVDPIKDKNLATVGVLEEETNPYKTEFVCTPKWKMNKGYRTILIAVGRRLDLGLQTAKSYVDRMKISVKTNNGNCDFVNRDILTVMDAELDAKFVVFDCNYERVETITITFIVDELTIRLNEIMIFRKEPFELLKELNREIQRRKKHTHVLTDPNEEIELLTLKESTQPKSTTSQPLDIVVTATVGNDWITRRRQEQPNLDSSSPLNPVATPTPSVLLPLNPKNLATTTYGSNEENEYGGMQELTDDRVATTPPEVVFVTEVEEKETGLSQREKTITEVNKEVDEEEFIPELDGSGYLVYSEYENETYSESFYNKTYWSSENGSWSNSYDSDDEDIPTKWSRIKRSLSILDRLGQTIKYYALGGYFTNFYNLNKFDAMQSTQNEIIEAIKSNKQALLEFTTHEKDILALICQQDKEISKEIMELKASVSLLDFKLVVLNSLDSCRQGEIPLLMTRQLVDKICQAYNDNEYCEDFHRLKVMKCQIIGIRVSNEEERELDIQMLFKIPATNGFKVWSVEPVIKPITNAMLNSKLIQKENLKSAENVTFWESINGIKNSYNNMYYYSVKKLPKRLITGEGLVGSTTKEGKFIFENEIEESCIENVYDSFNSSKCETMFVSGKPCMSKTIWPLGQIILSTHNDITIYEKEGLKDRTCNGICVLERNEFTMDCGDKIIQNNFTKIEMEIDAPIIQFSPTKTHILNQYLSKLNAEIEQTKSELKENKHHEFLEKLRISRPATKLVAIFIVAILVLMGLIYVVYKIRKYLINKMLNINYVKPKRIEKDQIGSPL